MTHIFSSESVTPGHPDKIADTISDHILDAVLYQDEQAVVSVETFIAGLDITVAGKVITQKHVELNVPSTVRGILYGLGFTADLGYDPERVQVRDLIGWKTVAAPARPLGADDQGLMFGYASNETSNLMPLPISLAHHLSARLYRLQDERLGPDAKTQVSVVYDGHTPVGLDTIVISTQHTSTIDLEGLRKFVSSEVVEPSLDVFNLLPPQRVLVNPEGERLVGGPVGKVGLSGRKIAVDTYGGAAHHGGGAFSGKDPSKLDRSAAYALRHVAKSLVYCGLMDRCEVQASYAIGKSEPVSVYVNDFGTARVRPAIVDGFLSRFDLRPQAIVEWLGDCETLRYSQATNFGHFGKEDVYLPWEIVSVS